MIKHFVIFLLLVSFIVSSYLPMSQKKHNFGSHICRYYDLEDQINYVKPCDTDKFCQDTETNSFGAKSKNELYTCQKYIYIPPNPTDPLKDLNQVCDDSLNECIPGLTCSTFGTDATKTCNRNCGTGESLFNIDGQYECRSIKDKCIYTKDGTNYDYMNERRNTCKVCGKINSEEKEDANHNKYRVLVTVDENDLFSQPDGTFVINPEACESRTALYFYLDGKTKNEIDLAHKSQNILYYRCVSIKAADYKNNRFNYTVGSDTVYIYEINLLTDDYNKQNELSNLCNLYYMTQIELWNKDRQEYISNLACPDENKWSDSFKRKVYYLEYPEQYLLYKDQTEVIEYLIQKKYPGIVPIQTTENISGYLSSKYIILSLILLIL